jgi:endonuclease YncB( thermonuclease family)
MQRAATGHNILMPYVPERAGFRYHAPWVSEPDELPETMRQRERIGRILRITKRARVAVPLLLLMVMAARAADAEPPAAAVAGDIITTGGKQYCLYGIDAPDAGQRCTLASGKTFDCGRIATTALMDLLAGASVRCMPTGQTRNGCPIARCEADGFDLSANMVHTGWALAGPGAPAQYRKLQTRAKDRRHGLWRGRFDPPWDWRRKQSSAKK